MLPEAAVEVSAGENLPPGFGDQLGVSTSLAVSSAGPKFRMARALGLVEEEQKLYLPRAELFLSIWLSSSAVVTVSHTYVAALSLGLTRASINGLGLPNPHAVSATTLHVSAMTAGRVNNAVDNKRDLFVNHDTLAFGVLVPRICTGGDWNLENVGGFPLPFFLLRSMYKKIKLELVEPSYTSVEEPDLDGQELNTYTAYAPSGQDWLFLPWYTSTLNWAGRAFGYKTSAPRAEGSHRGVIQMYWREHADKCAATVGRGRPFPTLERMLLATSATSSNDFFGAYTGRVSRWVLDFEAPAFIRGGTVSADIRIPDPELEEIQQWWNLIYGYVPRIFTSSGPVRISGTDPDNDDDDV
ncbi:hypothetical protein HPB51_026922 [Rhipicephalus microplus]|uniref:Uncharacterized protein n=1 Tax=Rhipicephalus microplus TaxID=6941 RepID=A0A9J6D1R7_RHIMP|nr:hypothetical protein HPB51_026922 [Rhipicephalus microplus]